MKNERFQQMSERIRAGFYSRTPFRETRRFVLVLKTGIAGMRYYVDPNTPKGRAIQKRLVTGAALKLYREPDNEHDPWAIAVHAPGGAIIGYVSRFKNETIARLMDMGRRFVARVDAPEDVSPDKRTRAWSEDYSLPMSIYMEE